MINGRLVHVFFRIVVMAQGRALHFGELREVWRDVRQFVAA
jgi:hypothetical protein